MILALIAISLAEDPKSDPAIATDRIAELSLARVQSGDTWTVRDGRSHEIDARSWAILTGDSNVLVQVDAARRKGRTFGWGLVIGGGGVALSSMVPLFMLEESFGVNENTPGFDELGTRNDTRVATAFSLLGAGVILAGTGFVSHAIADKRSLEITRHLEGTAADASITAYNKRLSETLTVVLPVAETGAVDLPDDLLAPAKVEPPAGTEAPAPTAAPTGTGAEPAEPAKEAVPPAPAPTDTTAPKETTAPTEATPPAGTAPVEPAPTGTPAPTEPASPKP